MSSTGAAALSTSTPSRCFPGVWNNRPTWGFAPARSAFAGYDKPVAYSIAFPFHMNPIASAMGTPFFDTVVNRLRRAEERSEEHTSELQSLMRISYAVFCLKKKKNTTKYTTKSTNRQLMKQTCENITIKY